MNHKKISFAILFLGVSLSLALCKKPEAEVQEAQDSPKALSAVVVFSVGDSKVRHADQTEEKAQLGTSLQAGDNVLTGDNGKVDIQFPDGSSVRISPKSQIDFSKLAQGASGSTETQIALVSGKVFVKVNKAQKTDSFSVVTPTAIAGVRGTSFIVESGSGKTGDKVKVVEGSVAFSPRVPALENLTEEQINADANLKKLSDSLHSVEVVLEKNQESKLSSKAAELSKIENVQNLDVDKAIKAIEKEKPNVEPAKLTKKEEEEIKTIVSVDKETAQAIAKLGENNNVEKLDEIKKQEIEKQRLALLEQVKKSQEEEKKKFETSLASQPKEFKSNKDIVNYYERIEKIELTDGREIIGAIIKQENNELVVHTEKGIQRIKMEDVDEVIYDMQTKKKF